MTISLISSARDRCFEWGGRGFRELAHIMVLSKFAVVLVHGLFSSASTWRHFDQLIATDPALEGLEVLHFEYSSPKIRWSPLKRIPDYNVIADNFRTYLEVETSSYPGLILVSHSQGGLVIQRYLARMLGDGRGHDLERIRRIVMFACPNSGSELFMIVRRGMKLWRHPQERELRPINEAVNDALKVVLNRVVHAAHVWSDQCPIPIIAYAGESDNVVTPASAKGIFPQTGVIPGDHFTIVRPDSLNHRAYTTLKAKLLAALPASALPTENKTSAAEGSTEISFSVDTLEDRSTVTASALPLTIEGRYSGEPGTVRVILEDSYRHYYVQNPDVRLLPGGTWLATNVIPGQGIIYIHFVALGDEGKRRFEQMVERREFGAFREMPPDSRILHSLRINRL